MTMEGSLSFFSSSTTDLRRSTGKGRGILSAGLLRAKKTPQHKNKTAATPIPIPAAPPVFSVIAEERLVVFEVVLYRVIEEFVPEKEVFAVALAVSVEVDVAVSVDVAVAEAEAEEDDVAVAEAEAEAEEDAVAVAEADAEEEAVAVAEADAEEEAVAVSVGTAAGPSAQQNVSVVEKAPVA